MLTKDVLKTLLQGMVAVPEDVDVIHERLEGVDMLTMKVNKMDVGKVIGKEGRMMNALIQVMRAVAYRQDGKSIELGIYNPTHPKSERVHGSLPPLPAEVEESVNQIKTP